MQSPWYMQLIGDGQLGFFVEEMSHLHIQSKFYIVAHLGGCMRIYTGRAGEAFQIEIQEYFGAQQLVYLNGGLEYAVRR